MTSGQIVRSHRERKGYGLRQVARLVELSPSYLSAIEHDKNLGSPSPDAAQRIFSALEVPINDRRICCLQWSERVRDEAFKWWGLMGVEVSWRELEGVA